MAVCKKIMRLNNEVDEKLAEQDERLEEADDDDDEDYLEEEEEGARPKGLDSDEDPWSFPESDETIEREVELAQGSILEDITDPTLPGHTEFVKLLYEDAMDQKNDDHPMEILDELETYQFMGRRIYREVLRLEEEDKFGRDIDFGEHPLAENEEFMGLRDHAEERAGDLELLNLINEPTLPKEELEQRIAKQLKQAGLLIDENNRFIKTVKKRDIPKLLEGDDDHTRRFLLGNTPEYMRTHLRMDEEAHTPVYHGNKARFYLSDEYPISITSHSFASGQDHYKERKVVLKVKLSALKLSPPAKRRLLDMVANRYNAENDVLTIVARNQPSKQDNKFFAKSLLKSLLAEAWKADENYLPLKDVPSEDPTDLSFLNKPQPYSLFHLPVSWLNLKLEENPPLQ